MAESKRKRKADPEFYKRFKAIAEDPEMTNTALGAALGVSSSQVTRLRGEDAGSIRFGDGLKLCEHFGIDPWMLAFGKPRGPKKATLPKRAASLFPTLSDDDGGVGTGSHSAEEIAAAEDRLRLTELVEDLGGRVEALESAAKSKRARSAHRKQRKRPRAS